MGKFIKSLISSNGYDNSNAARVVDLNEGGTYLVVSAIGGASGTNYGAITTSGGTEKHSVHNSVRSNTYSSYNEFVGLRTYIAQSNSAFSISSSFQTPNNCRSQNIIAYKINSVSTLTNNTSTTYTSEGTRTYSLNKGIYIVSVAVCGGNDNPDYATITVSANNNAVIDMFENAKSIGNGNYTSYLGTCCFEIEVVEDSTTLTITTLRNGNKSVAVATQIISVSAYKVSVGIEPNDSGTVSGDDYWGSGTVATLMATPNSGYSFVDWKLKGYTRLDYIKSTGTQYIDTGVQLGTSDFSIDAEFLITGNNGGENAIFSIWTSSAGYWNLFYSSAYWLDFYSNAHHYTNYLTVGGRYNFIVKKEGSTWTYGESDNLSTSNNLNSGNNNTLKALARGDGACKSIGKLYSFKVTVNDTLVRDFIPTIRHSDMAIGLFDLVNMKFYGNAGTGVFRNYTLDTSNLAVYGTQNKWFQATYDKPVFLKRYSGNNASDGSYSKAWTMTLKGSNDGSNWTDIQSNEMTATGTNIVDVSCDTPYQYFRWYFSNYNNSYQNGRCIFDNILIDGGWDDTTTNITFTDNPFSFNIVDNFEFIATFGRSANCRLKVNGEWKYGMMYKKINGEWVLGTIKVKQSGTWKDGG